MYPDKCCLVYDNGLFVELAVTLARDFGRVLYFAPWTTGYPTSNALRVGDGLDGVERVDEPWTHIDAVDLFVFPDVYEAGLQQYLVSIGKRVWGCRGGAELELDRVASKEKSRKLGIDIGPYKEITGLDALRRHLKRHDDQYVKISATRGDMETFHSPNYAEAETRLDELEHKLGAKKKIMKFIVEEGLSPAIEVGYDGYTIDGKFPRGALVGVEVKDKGYVGRTMRYGELPERVRSVNEKLAPALKGYGYRGFISTEIRCTEDGKAYLIDPCARSGSPPSELYQNMVGNIADVLWHGADGLVVEPEYEAKWGAEVLLLSDWGDTNWQQISFPADVRHNVKLRNMTVIDGEYYVVPQSLGAPEIGAVVAMGDTAQEAIDECKRIAKLVTGFQVEAPVEAMDEALDNLRELLRDKGADAAPKSPALRKRAAAMMADGAISRRQYDKMMERE